MYGANRLRHIADQEVDDGPYAQQDAEFERRIHVKLYELYPGQPWLVTVKTHPRKGYIKLSLPALMDCDFDLPIKHFWDTRQPGERLWKAAGEILERFQVPRAGWSFEEMMRASEIFGPAEGWRFNMPGGL